MATTKNPFGKTRGVEDPYAIYSGPAGWEWRVLKTYKRPDKEQADAYARWLVAASSPYTFGSHEMGDEYATNVRPYMLVSCTDEWKEHYGAPSS